MRRGIGVSKVMRGHSSISSSPCTSLTTGASVRTSPTTSSLTAWDSLDATPTTPGSCGTSGSQLLRPRRLAGRQPHASRSSPAALASPVPAPGPVPAWCRPGATTTMVQLSWSEPPRCSIVVVSGPACRRTGDARGASGAPDAGSGPAAVLPDGSVCHRPRWGRGPRLPRLVGSPAKGKRGRRAFLRPGVLAYDYNSLMLSVFTSTVLTEMRSLP